MTLNHKRPAADRWHGQARHCPANRIGGTHADAYGLDLPPARHQRDAFSLIELLTVVFIISLLIGMLIPSLNSARSAAKKATTSKTIESIQVGLEMFKNDNGRDFRQTNGYPPSFQHPPVPGYDHNDVLYQGRFPFIPDFEGTPPVVYGAHWLPAMLMGPHQLGYVKRSSVPAKDNLRPRPWLWYSTDDGASDLLPLEGPLYVDPGNIQTKRTRDLPGQPNLTDFFPDWGSSSGDETDDMEMDDLPVIVDAFDQPMLYYVAGSHGRVTNMLHDDRVANQDYTGSGQQERGVPFYFHQDNEGFTGTTSDSSSTGAPGWDFGAHPKEHLIGKSGAELTAVGLIDPENRETFARYIVDRKIFAGLGPTPRENAPLRPVNADSYLLITAGPDGRYGTNDDVSNLPAWPD